MGILCYKNNVSQDQDGHMPTCGKNPSKIFSGTGGLISTKHKAWHLA